MRIYGEFYWEWCVDWFDGRYYSISPTENPQGPDAEADFVAFCDSFCDWLMGVLAPPDVEVDLGLCAVNFVYVDSE